MSIPHPPKLQHYLSLTIRLFSVISRTLVEGESYPSAEMQSAYSLAPADWTRNRWIQAFPKSISAKWNARPSSRIWTRVTDSISRDDNRYAKHSSFYFVDLVLMSVTFTNLCIYPTLPLNQNATQGPFKAKFTKVEFCVIFLLDWLPYQR